MESAPLNSLRMVIPLTSEKHQNAIKELLDHVHAIIIASEGMELFKTYFGCLPDYEELVKDGSMLCTRSQAVALRDMCKILREDPDKDRQSFSELYDQITHEVTTSTVPLQPIDLAPLYPKISILDNL